MFPEYFCLFTKVRVMSRDALVVGINLYQQGGLQPLRSPANDAEAIAQRLEQYGHFRIWRLPEFLDPFDNNAHRVAQNQIITVTQLEEALVRLFKPEGEHIPETALFYFSGHGLRKNRGIQEGYLATSEVNPDNDQWGLSLQWLRRLLQASPVRQQIVWLDCCYSGELLNFEEADPGDRSKGSDRCFIAASREFEVAYAGSVGQHSVLTEALIQALDPTQRANGVVTNFTITEFLEQHLQAATQSPLFANSGGKIILTGRPQDTDGVVAEGKCPYKALNYFDCNDEDPKYFFGRTALTDALIEKVRIGNFLAVVGASGSGKSSVVRAGLMHQLKSGSRLSGSNQWSIHLFQPGVHPLQSLTNAFLATDAPIVDQAAQLQKLTQLISAGSTGLGLLVDATPHRLVLVIDQFEECFTQCRDPVERQQFFACLLGALERSDLKLCLVLTLRADFFGKCLEQDYSGLAKQIEDHLVAVTPMNWEELEQAIVEPAKQVGLEIEPDLVTQMITDVQGAPGSLPLLQYTLTELWQHRAVNWLTFAAYTSLGGVRGTLQQSAEEIYASLNAQEQDVAKYIFLELTQLGDGEGVADTRRQVPKREFISTQQSAAMVEAVLVRLLEARLIVTTELIEKNQASRHIEVIDVAHEALIRYWPRLHGWIEENRVALRKKHELESDAGVWLENGKSTELAYLLQGSKLFEAQAFIKQHGDRLPLSSTTIDFIHISRLQERQRQRVRWSVILAFPMLIILFLGAFGLQQQQSKQRLQQTIQGLFLSDDPATVAQALPLSFTAANALERNPTNENIDLALSYYRRIMVVTSRLAKQPANPLNSPFSQAHAQAESRMATLINQYRMGELKNYLEHSQFGKPIPNAKFTLFEKAFTQGALQTTYKILMLNFGAGADLNRDGQLSEDEAQLMPCKTLKTIEILWRTRKSNCSWDDTNCIEMPIDKTQKLSSQSLATAIFDPAGVEYAIDRIKACPPIKNQNGS